MGQRRNAMIELTEAQLKALDALAEQPPVAIDPRTQEAFVLLRQEAYEKMRRLIDGMTRSAGWDDPALDDYERYRHKA
jgi:hypothetical protein